MLPSALSPAHRPGCSTWGHLQSCPDPGCPHGPPSPWVFRGQHPYLPLRVENGRGQLWINALWLFLWTFREKKKSEYKGTPWFKLGVFWGRLWFSHPTPWAWSIFVNVLEQKQRSLGKSSAGFAGPHVPRSNFCLRLLRFSLSLFCRFKL